jgi:23S rRNA pseudouridine955/2504/2580 synthase
MFELKAMPDDNNRRLDRILRKFFPELPLSRIYGLLRKGKILVNGRKAGAAGVRVIAGDVIAVPDEISVTRGKTAGVGEGISPETAVFSVLQIFLDIIYENDDLLVVNKPVGILVHGESCEKNLTKQVESYLADKIPPSLSFKPGPLHRLDQPTSGLIAFSKSLAGARLFTSLIREHRIVKRYLALVDGCMEKSELWKDSLVRNKDERKTFTVDNKGALQAETLVVPLASNPKYTLISAEIHTGRTHQIRSQAAFHGHPLAGDKKYGGSFLEYGLSLHAYSLEFPVETGLPLLKAPLPKSFQERLLLFMPIPKLDPAEGTRI